MALIFPAEILCLSTFASGFQDMTSEQTEQGAAGAARKMRNWTVSTSLSLWHALVSVYIKFSALASFAPCEDGRVESVLCIA